MESWETLKARFDHLSRSSLRPQWERWEILLLLHQQHHLACTASQLAKGPTNQEPRNHRNNTVPSQALKHQVMKVEVVKSGQLDLFLKKP